MIKYIVPSAELTKEQQKFASENYHIAKNFMKCRNLKNSRYSGIVMESFIKAVRRYFICRELWIYNFSAVALYTIKNDLRYYRKNRFSKKLNTPAVYDENMEYCGCGLAPAKVITAPGSPAEYLDIAE